MIEAIAIFLKHSTGIVGTLSEESFSRYKTPSNIWDEAQKTLDNWSLLVKMSYDDVDFKIVFSDGYIYGGTLEIYHPKTCSNEKLNQHIKNHLLYYSGRKLLKNHNQEENEKFLETFSPEPGRSELCRILDTYDLDH